MSKPLVDRIPFAKIVIVLASAFGIALGLCGMNLVLLNLGIGVGHNSGNYFGGPLLSTLGIVELAVMVISAVGLVITVAAWVITSAVGGFRRGESEPQQLFNYEDKDRHT